MQCERIVAVAAVFLIVGCGQEQEQDESGDLLLNSPVGSETPADPDPDETVDTGSESVEQTPEEGGDPVGDEGEDTEPIEEPEPEPEPVAAPALGQTGTPTGVTVVLIAQAPVVNEPTDLKFDPSEPEFKFGPDEPEELWVVNRGNESFTIITDPKPYAHDTVIHYDYTHHFMEAVIALSFGDEGTFATCGDTQNNYHGWETPDDFMGPALWPAEADDFDEYACGAVTPTCPDAANVHLDMLHGTPNCMGVAAAGANTFYAFNGKYGSIELYDFNEPHSDVWHGHGGEDHTDGEKYRVVQKGVVSRVAGVPSHMVYVGAEEMLYVADTGNSRLLKIHVGGLVQGSNIWENYDQGTTFVEMNGATIEELVSADSGLLQQPSGLIIRDEWLYVADHQTGHILAFDMAGNLVNDLDTGRGEGALGGLAFDNEGRLFFADTLRSEIIRLEPK